MTSFNQRKPNELINGIKPELREFFKKYGTQTTTNFDLIEIAKRKELNLFIML